MLPSDLLGLWDDKTSPREPKIEAASGSSGETLALAAAALIREQDGKLGPVPRADLAKGVRDVTLDGLRRQEQGLRDIAVALAARRQARDLALALGQAGQEISVGRRRPPPPGAHTEGTEPLLREALLRLRPDLGGEPGCGPQRLDRTAPVDGSEDRREIEPRPESFDDELEPLGLRLRGLETRHSGVGLPLVDVEQGLDPAAEELLLRLRTQLERVPCRKRGLCLGGLSDACECLGGHEEKLG